MPTPDPTLDARVAELAALLPTPLPRHSRHLDMPPQAATIRLRAERTRREELDTLSPTRREVALIYAAADELDARAVITHRLPLPRVKSTDTDREWLERAVRDFPRDYRPISASLADGGGL